MIALVFYFVAVLYEDSAPSGVSVTGWVDNRVRVTCVVQHEMQMPAEAEDGPSWASCRESDAPWATENFAEFGPYFEFQDCERDKGTVVRRRNPWSESGMSACYARERQVRID